MALLDDLKNASLFAHPTGGKCTFCTFLETLSKADKTALQVRLDDKSTTSASLSRVLKKNGHNISEGVVSRHRRGDCANGTRG